MNSPEKDVSGRAVPSLVERVLAMPRDGKRKLVAIAGAPASGKSTLAASVAAALNANGCGARTIPMDGFHLDNRLLDARGLRSRKGAPETFDADGFIALMTRVKKEEEVVFPIFDRARDLAIAGADVIGAECEVAVVEGNYLLFDERPWSALQPLWDLSAWVETPLEILRERCIQRWLEHDHTPDAARARAEGNDLANARRIVEKRLPADVVVTDQ